MIPLCPRWKQKTQQPKAYARSPSPPLGDDPPSGPEKSAVLRLMIKHEGKISKAFFSCGTPRFKNIFLKIYILTAVLYPVLTSETGNLLLLGPTSGKPNVRVLGPTENLSKVQGRSKQTTRHSDAGFFFFFTQGSFRHLLFERRLPPLPPPKGHQAVITEVL